MDIRGKVKSFFGLERNIVVILVANLFWATIVVYQNFKPKFYESLGASVFFVGVLYSLGELFYSLSSFIGGHLSDTYGRKYVLARASFAVSFILLGFYFAPDWIFLLPFLILGSFTSGLEDASAQTFISESLPKKRRATGTASIYLAAIILSVVLIPIGGFLVESYGMLEGIRTAIIISFFCYFVGSTIFFFYGKETLRSRKKTKQKLKFTFNFSNITHFVRKLPLSVKGMLLFISLFYFCAALIGPYWIFYALDIIKINSFEFGILASVQFVTVAASSFIGAKLSDKYGRKKLFLASAILFLFAPILFIFSQNFFHLVIVQLIVGVSTVGFTSIFAYITDNIDQKRRARAIGMTNGMMSFVGISAPVIGSLLYSFVPQYPFVFASALLVVNLLIGIKFLK